MAIASLILGIIGILFAIIPWTWISMLGIILGIVTIIMAAVDLSQSRKKGLIPHKLSKIGLILGIVAVGVGVIILLITTLHTIYIYQLNQELNQAISSLGVLSPSYDSYY